MLELTGPESTKVGDAALYNLGTEQIHEKSLRTPRCNVVATHTSFDARQTDLGFPFRLCPLLAVGTWVSYFFSLNLSFLNHQKEIITRTS